MTAYIADLVTIESEIRRIRRATEPDRLRKKEIEAELGTIGGRIRSSGYRGLAQHEYKALCGRQNRLRNEMLEIDKRLSSARAQMGEWHEMKLEASLNIAAPTSVIGSVIGVATSHVSRLAALRDKWQSFAEDPTRINSMRLLSATFARELTEILNSNEESSE